MTTPVKRIEAIMASLVQERSRMNMRKGTSNKLNANLGSVQKREDMENPKSKLEAGIGTSATIDNKQVANGEAGSSMTTNATDNTTLKKRKKKNNNPDLGGILSTHDSTQEGLSTTEVLEVKSCEMISAKTATPDANIVSKGDALEVASGKLVESETANNGNGASGLTKSQKWNRLKARKKKLNANLGSSGKGEDTGISSAGTGDGTSSSSKVNEHTKVAIGEMGSSLTTNLIGVVEVQTKMETNPDLGGILSTRESTEEGLSTTKVLEVTSGEMISVSAKTATPDANIESKGDLSEVASGKMEERKTTNNGNDASKLTGSQKRKVKALKKILYANLGSSEKGEDTGISSTGTGDGKSSNSKEKIHTKVGNGEMGSSLTTNLIVEVEVQKKMEANLDCGILSTRESTEEGLSTTKVLEVTSGDMISAKTATPDANTVLKGDHLVVNSGKMEESETANNCNVAPELTKSQKRNRLKARKKKLNANLGSSEKGEHTSISSPGTGDRKSSSFKEKEYTKVSIGEIGSSLTTNLNGEVDVQKKMEAIIGETSLGVTAAANTTLKKRKRKKIMNDNPDLGGILSFRKSTEEGLSTTEVLEVKSCEMISAKTATPDANIVSKEDALEVASGKLVESETANNGNGASGLTKSQKWNRLKARKKKLNANLGSSGKGEDTGISSAGTGDGTSSSSKVNEHTKVAIGEMGSSLTTNLIGVVEVQTKMETNPDLGGILSTRESTEEGLSTTKVLEVTSGEMISVSAKTATPDANIESKGDLSEVASGKMEERKTTNNGNDASKLTRSQKRNKVKALKKILYANLGSSEKGEDTGISSTGTGDGKSSNSKEKLHTKVGNGEMGSSLTTNLIVEVEVQKKMEANPDCGILSTRESTEEGLSTTKVLEVTSGDMISAKTATPDANAVLKGDHLVVYSGKMEESETANNCNVAPELTKSQKRNRLKARKKKLNANLGSSEKGEHTSISSAGTGDGKSSSFKETSLGITAEANTTLKKRKRKKIMNNNPDLGGILSSRKSTEEGLSTTEVLEVKSCEIISAKTATPDANMVSIGYHSEVASGGKMKESEASNDGNEITNKALENMLNANLGSLEKREDTENPKSKPEVQFYTISLSSIQDNPNTGISSACIGDGKSSSFNVKEHTEVANGEMGSSLTANLNREVEVQKAMETTIGNTSSGTNARDNTISKKRKRNRKKMNNNPDLGDILSTRESTQGLGMNKVLEVTCNETVSSKTTIPDANMLAKEVVANIKTGESETTNVNVNVIQVRVKPVQLASPGQTGSVGREKQGHVEVENKSG